MTIKDFILDNGYKSRKFLLVLTSIILICAASILWAKYLWNIELFRIIADSIVTLALGFCGISTVRAALPMSASVVAETRKQKDKPNSPPTKDIDKGSEEP